MSTPRSARLVSLLAVFLVCFFIEGSRALECYDCNSHIDPLCADEIPPESAKKPCNELPGGSGYTLCRKIEQTIDFSVNDLEPDRRIVRMCGWDESSYSNSCYEKRPSPGIVQKVCACRYDYCNGGGFSSW
ncbi:uncharacterized protein [Neodiprion pinetum]|uniref:Uncharacterized protein LOC107228023 n=1 Tax=Neodiprion lecontei TaxID=441921 RepID=A0A6J0CBV5_NEOLC|nr:uncharacterized protein LOC107228023 [Neodiprion lecontei]XP_046429398.1 uncharacterized protein LOC124184067 [Neodiprion fabricii]XP_046482148.1 uncharacterized protein LOC124219064 [Neodiprion pinetum]XP_046619576.1 uncharacterized protein LOC124304881 [Neodiprion virginianus]